MPQFNRDIIIVRDVSELVKKLSSLIEIIANTSIQRDGKFTVGLSGGSLVKFLSQGLPHVTTEWSKWIFFFCDERVVPFESADSTFGEYKKAVIGSIPVDEKQFISINPNLSGEEAAKDYIKKMQEYFSSEAFPRFNLLLLGVGEDGHTCSLFPGHPLLSEEKAWVASITDSPKPPPSRITFTLPVINSAENCIFPLAGEGKANVLKAMLVDDVHFPANMVNPKKGKVFWILDKAASAHLI